MRESKILTIIAYLSVLFFYCVCEDPCDFQLSVDITNGSKFLNGTMEHDGLRYSPKQYFKFIDEGKRNKTRGCICLVKTCMSKCCPMGQGLKNNICVRNEEVLVKEFNPQIHSGKETSKLTAKNHFIVIHNPSCRKGLIRFGINSNVENPDLFYLQENGSLYLPYFKERYLGPTDYCLDVFIDQPKFTMAVGKWLSESRTTRYLVNICIENSTKLRSRAIPFTVEIYVSLPFLLATFLVYAFVPELRNLQGKLLMNYIAGLILAFISQIIIRQRYYTLLNIYPNFFYYFTKNPDIAGCVFMAFSMYFFFMVCFFWLNIMCINVWMTFRNVRVPRLGRREADGWRYVLYCLYGWGGPLLLTALLAFMQFNEDLPKSYIKPGFGQMSCWFSDLKSNLVYFYSPVLILLVFNLLLFSITSYKILTIKRETAVLNIAGNTRNDQATNEKQGFFVYLKLFIFMGMSWIAGAINSVFGDSIFIWFTLDLYKVFTCFNTMQGVVIFFFFVWKRQVKNLIIKRYNTLRYGPSVPDTQMS